jgi:hypothetical protein
MKLLLEQFGIAWLGLVTTLLVVITDVTVLRWNGLSLVGTSVNWIPVGAMIGGMVAASGYYIGARYTHSRATPFLLVLMVFIAGLAYFLIYWLDYTHREVGGTSVRDWMTFGEFVDHRLTNTRIIDRKGSVGVLGYLLGLVEFIGFLVGGFGVYAFLASRQMCPSCDLYLNTLVISEKEFGEVDALMSYISGIKKNLASPQMPVTTWDNVVASRPKPGSMKVTFVLFGCPFCKYQVIEQSVSIRNGEEWDNIDSLSRTFQIPPEVDAKSRIALK